MGVLIVLVRFVFNMFLVEIGCRQIESGGEIWARWSGGFVARWCYCFSQPVINITPPAGVAHHKIQSPSSPNIQKGPFCANDDTTTFRLILIPHNAYFFLNNTDHEYRSNTQLLTVKRHDQKTDNISNQPALQLTFPPIKILSIIV